MNTLQNFCGVSTLLNGLLVIFLGVCLSCSGSDSKSSSSSSAQTCSIKTDKVAENSLSRLPSINDFGGSTFTACKTGVLTTLSFKTNEESAEQPTAMLFIENGIGNGVVENQTYADYVQDISIVGSGKTATIKLTTPFPVTKGEVYTWYVQKDPDAGELIQASGVEPDNSYADGATWYNNDYYPSMDNLFSIQIK